MVPLGHREASVKSKGGGSAIGGEAWPQEEAVRGRQQEKWEGRETKEARLTPGGLCQWPLDLSPAHVCWINTQRYHLYGR